MKFNTKKYLLTISLILTVSVAITILGPIVFAVMSGHLFVAVKEYLLGMALLTVTAIILVTLFFLIREGRDKGISDKDKKKTEHIQVINKMAICSFYIPFFNCLVIIMGTIMWVGIAEISPVLCVVGYTLRSLGILGVFVTATLGLTYGSEGLREIKRSDGETKGRKLATAGIALSIIMWIYLLVKIVLRVWYPNYYFPIPI